MKIYFCGNDLAKQINITSESSFFGHKKYTFKKEVFLWPEHFNKTSISPQTFLAHKKKQGIEKLIIIDRIKNFEGITKINEHINRSGTSFLIAETPFEDRPTFPDMSKIYGEKVGETVIRLGQIGLLKMTNKKQRQHQKPLRPLRRCGTMSAFPYKPMGVEIILQTR